MSKTANTKDTKKKVAEATKGIEIVAVPQWEENKKGDVLVMSPKVDENLFVKFMEEHYNLDEKTLKEFEKGANDYLKRVSGLAALKGGEILKKDSELKAVEVRMPFGTRKSDIARAIAIREQKVRNIQTGEEIIRPAIKMAVKTSFTKVSTGHIGKCREYLEELLEK